MFDFQKAFTAAKDGDTLRIPAGAYGVQRLSRRTFVNGITIVADDPANPPVFASLVVFQCAGITLDGLSVNFTPDATTGTASPGCQVNGSQRVTLRNMTIHGNPCPAGIGADPATLKSTTALISGYPAGRGFSIDSSSDVLIQGNDVGGFDRGVEFFNSQRVQLLANTVHDIRRSFVVGGGTDNLTIDGNTFRSAKPWGWGVVGGDHGEFIHLNTSVGQAARTHDITITHNLLDQGDGTPIMGISMDDNTNNVGFQNITVDSNVLLNGDAQGVLLGNTLNGRVTNNLILQASGTPKDGPAFLFTKGCGPVVVTGNILADTYNNMQPYPNNTIWPPQIATARELALARRSL